eukprot:1099419-Rhodomonas_salina.1
MERPAILVGIPTGMCIPGYGRNRKYPGSRVRWKDLEKSHGQGSEKMSFATRTRGGEGRRRRQRQ